MVALFERAFQPKCVTFDNFNLLFMWMDSKILIHLGGDLLWHIECQGMRPFSPGSKSWFSTVLISQISHFHHLDNEGRGWKFTFMFQYSRMNSLYNKFCLLTVYCGGKVTGRERKIFQSISGNMKNSADNATIHLIWQWNLPHWWF